MYTYIMTEQCQVQIFPDNTRSTGTERRRGGGGGGRGDYNQSTTTNLTILLTANVHQMCFELFYN